MKPCGIEHENVEIFQKFLREHLREGVVSDVEEWLPDLERASGESSSLEISGDLTKDGRPAIYYFRRKAFIATDGDGTWDHKADWGKKIVHGEMDRPVTLVVRKDLAGEEFRAQIERDAEEGRAGAEFLLQDGELVVETFIAQTVLKYAADRLGWEFGDKSLRIE